MNIIENELDQIREEWNNHHIRAQWKLGGAGCPSGKPEIMFSYTQLYGNFIMFTF